MKRCRAWPPSALRRTRKKAAGFAPLVVGKSPGDEPSSAGKPDARRHVLRFEVAAETLAFFREAMNKLKRSGTPLDDDSALMLMARHVLGGPADAGRASYQIALSVCPTCDRGYQHASGQHIGVITTSVAGAEPAKGESAHVGARRAKDERAHVGAEPAKDECAHVGAALIRAIGGVRAKQTVSPATRRAVRRRAAHRGELVVSGSVASGIRFRHADGNDYGKGPQPSAVEMQAKAFAALRGLGFREGEVRRALAESCELGVPEMNLERVVRGALARLTPQPVHI